MIRRVGLVLGLLVLWLTMLSVAVTLLRSMPLWTLVVSGVIVFLLMRRRRQAAVSPVESSTVDDASRPSFSPFRSGF